MLGVILTGANEDGANGTFHIDLLGGIVIAQRGAEYPQMPNAAVATGAVHHQLPLETLSCAIIALCMLPGAASWMQRFTTEIRQLFLESGDYRNFRSQSSLALGRAGVATPSFLLQLVNFFRSFRFGPLLIEFFPGFAAERLEIGALRASHRLVFCYPLVGIFLWIQ